MTAKATPTLENLIELYGVPDPSVVGKLPRVTCAKCRDKKENPGGVCSQHAKVDCTKEKQPRRTDGWCGNWMTERHMHIDYVGHAEITRILTEIDVYWTWEPLYEPPVDRSGGEAVMWGKLTLLGKTLIGVGTCEKGKHDEAKELVGDFLRNAAMRFGIGLKLWSKQEWEEQVDETPAPTSPPQDRIVSVDPKIAKDAIDKALATENFKPVVTEEEKAAAAALVDPETHPDNALKAKYGSTARALKAARDYCKANDIEEQPGSFPALVADFPELVKILLEQP